MKKIDPNSFDLEKMTDAELRPFVEKIIEKELAEAASISPSERERRAEIRRSLAEFKEAKKSAKLMPLVTSDGDNPCYDLVRLGREVQPVKLIMPSEDSLRREIPGTLNLVVLSPESGVDASAPIEEPFVERPPERTKTVAKDTESRLAAKSRALADSVKSNPESPYKSMDHYFFTFRLKVKLPADMSIVSADLFGNPDNEDVDEFLKSLAQNDHSLPTATALFNCRPIPGEVDTYELFTRCTEVRLIEISSVLALRVKEDRK